MPITAPSKGNATPKRWLISDRNSGLGDISTGSGLKNNCLTYRITALSSGRGAALAGSTVKHFGTNRPGRSGLAHYPPLVDSPPATDNVRVVDCSSFFPPKLRGLDIHSAYFANDGVVGLMCQILRGIDRTVLDQLNLTKGKAWVA